MPSETPGAGSAKPQMDWEALARYMAGESPAAERVAIEQWLGDHPDDAKMIVALDDAVGRLMLGPDATKGIDVEAALAKVNAKRSAPGLRVEQGGMASPGRAARSVAPSRHRWMGYATAAALILALGALLWRDREPASDFPATSIAERTITTQVGGRDSLVLPDGSNVILGPGSRLTIAQGYGQTTRGVVIRGEAFFKVKHDDARPFLVTAHGTSIKDVGTAFVVHSDSTGDVRIVVTEGSVEVQPVAGQSTAALLNAGDVATVSRSGAFAARRGTATDDDIAWTRGKLVFRDTPLSEVRDDLRRWYGIHLDVRDSALLRRPYTGSFQGDSVKQVLDVISQALGVSIEHRGDTAIVRLAPDANRRE